MSKSKSSRPARRRAGQHPQRPAGGRGRGGSRREFPVLAAVAAAAVLIVALVIGGVYFKMTYKPPPPSYPPIDGVSCAKSTPTGSQFHVNLQVYYQETPVPIPSNVGVKSDCSYWIHTSDSSGVIAVTLPEAEKDQTYTLGTFFKIWGQPIDLHHVATLKTGDDVHMKVWVDGKPYSGNPAHIPLSSHKTIVIQFGPPFLEPPPSYTWNTKEYPR